MALLLVSEAAEHFQVAESSVRRWIAKGAPSVRVQGRILVDPVDLEAWFEGDEAETEDLPEEDEPEGEDSEEEVPEEGEEDPEDDDSEEEE